jgi:hypothetical protein
VVIINKGAIDRDTVLGLVIGLAVFLIAFGLFKWITTPAQGVEGMVGLSPIQQMSDADAAFNASFYDEAIRLYRDYLDKFSEDKNAFLAQYKIGESYAAMNNTKMALAAYKATKENYKLSDEWAATIDDKIRNAELEALNGVSGGAH